MEDETKETTGKEAEGEVKTSKGVLMDLPIEVHGRLAARAHGNDRSIKAEAERIVRLAVMGDCMNANTTIKQEGQQ